MNGARRDLAAAFAAAALLHGAALAWILTRPPPVLRAAPRPPTTVRLVARTPPPAKPPAPRPEPPPPSRPREPAAPRTVVRADPRPAAPAPAPQAPEPAPASPPPRRRFAVSMEAVVPGGSGGVAVPTTEGRTAARGDPTLPPSAPVGDNAAPPADVTEVERAPRPRRQPSGAEIMAYYPQAAREEQREADVRVSLLVSERGEVVDVRIRAGGANGFGEAAARVARLLAFEPATRGGQPVAVWIPWTIKFRLDG